MHRVVFNGFARGYALALVIAPFAIMARAEAACAPTSPVNDTIVTCTGATVDQNGFTGYGSISDTGNTYNIVTGASITGAGSGLIFSRGTVNNSGTISANGSFVFFGVFGNNDAVVNNSGTISANGFGSNGVGSLNFHVTNSGTIQANGVGSHALDAGGGTSDFTNTGVLAADGALGVAVDVNGFIKANNSGLIRASGTNGQGIVAGRAEVINSGTIAAVVTGIFGGNVTVDNAG